jgi:Uma2 family endonuclease
MNGENRNMPSLIVQPEGVTIPAYVVDLTSFTQWVDSPDFPESGQYAYMHGKVWMDVSMEQPFVHNQVKLWITVVLASLARDGNLGRFFADRMRLRNDEADLSTEPDGMFVSYQSSRSGRVRLVAGKMTQYREFEGSPDMVLEVVSDTSEEKDRYDLREAYFQAGIDEYWLVDARGADCELDILKLGPRAYVNTRHQAGGWVRSRIFGRAFRLVRSEGPDGNPQFTLEHRD